MARELVYFFTYTVSQSSSVQIITAEPRILKTTPSTKTNFSESSP